MNLALLAPAALFALAAIALPILLHLVRRLELQATEFAALRWIAARVPPRRRIRFERPWLLLLRVLLVALLALLLAQPVWRAVGAAAPARVFVVPGADRVAAQAAIAAVGAQAHWLAAGFPAFDHPMPDGAPPVSSLLREADAALPEGAMLHVVVPRELGGLDGERVRLAHAVDWRVVDGRSPERAPETAASVRVAVRHDPADTTSPRWLRAAVAAWNLREPGRYLLDEATIDVPLPADTDWLAWLAADPPAQVTQWISNGGTALLAHQPGASGDVPWRDAQGRALAQVAASGRGRVIALPSALAPASLPLLPEPGFPDRLLALLQGDALPPDRAQAEVARPVVDAARADTASVRFADARPLDAWLALLAAALFLLERVVATRRHAGSEP